MAKLYSTSESTPEVRESYVPTPLVVPNEGEAETHFDVNFDSDKMQDLDSLVGAIKKTDKELRFEDKKQKFKVLLDLIKRL